MRNAIKMDTSVTSLFSPEYRLVFPVWSSMWHWDCQFTQFPTQSHFWHSNGYHTLLALECHVADSVVWSWRWHLLWSLHLTFHSHVRLNIPMRAHLCQVKHTVVVLHCWFASLSTIVWTFWVSFTLARRFYASNKSNQWSFDPFATNAASPRWMMQRDYCFWF